MPIAAFTDALTRKDEACTDEPDKSLDHELPPDVDLDDLGVDEGPMHSIPHLVAEKRTSTDLARLRAKIKALADQNTQTLIVKIETQADPLILWELHLELDRRGIPPAQRWPVNSCGTAQSRFITVLADLHWLVTRYSSHAPPSMFRNWLGLFKLAPGSDAWLTKAYFLYKNLSQTNLARSGTRAMALTPRQRQNLMAFPTAAMWKRRQQLETDKHVETHQALYSEAMANPYRARAFNPEHAANRRATLWRVFVLSDFSPTETTRNWKLVTGESVTRQAITKQITTIKTALKKHCS
ncbi:hypothetical protein POHY109586_01320 [Polaromonas hydrogenivorans]